MRRSLTLVNKARPSATQCPWGPSPCPNTATTTTTTTTTQQSTVLPWPGLQHALSWRKRRTYLALLLTQRNGEPVPEGEEGEAELAFPNLLPSPAVLRPVLEELEPLIADKDAAGKGKAATSEPKKRK